MKAVGSAVTLALCLFMVGGCGCGDRVAIRSITITEGLGGNSGAWGPVEVDTSQLPPDSVEHRVDRIDECGNPVSELRIFPNRPIKIMIVPATGPSTDK